MKPTYLVGHVNLRDIAINWVASTSGHQKHHKSQSMLILGYVFKNAWNLGWEDQEIFFLKIIIFILYLNLLWHKQKNVECDDHLHEGPQENELGNRKQRMFLRFFENPFVTKFNWVKGYEHGGRNYFTEWLPNRLWCGGIAWVWGMQNFYSPGINSDILASYDKGIQNQKARKLVNLFLEKQVHDIVGEVEENAAANQLSWDDPRFPLTHLLKIV